MCLKSSARSRFAIGVPAMAALLLMSTAAFSGPAAAARPEVHKHSCSDVGGVFTKTSGVKTCTTVGTTTRVGPEVTATASIGGPLGGLGCTGLPQCNGFFRVIWTGTSQRTTVVQVTTATSQKGNGDVNVTTAEKLVSSHVVPLACDTRSEIHVPGAHVEVRNAATTPLQVCEERNLFTA